LWVSERSSPGESFDTPAPLVGVNGADDDDSPALSADGLTLFFTSDRTGQSQVWVASRATLEDEFQNPEPLAEVASDGNDVDVTLSADDRELVISSDRGGSQRLWVARRQCP
jgi:Tol biopolymer transport system component